MATKTNEQSNAGHSNEQLVTRKRLRRMRSVFRDGERWADDGWFSKPSADHPEGAVCLLGGLAQVLLEETKGPKVELGAWFDTLQGSVLGHQSPAEALPESVVLALFCALLRQAPDDQVQEWVDQYGDDSLIVSGSASTTDTLLLAQSVPHVSRVDVLIEFNDEDASWKDVSALLQTAELYL